MPLRDDDGPIEDRWTRVSLGEALVEFSILEFSGVDERGEEIETRKPSALGFHVANDVDVHTVVPWFERVALISVDFPSFADGRGFSLGRKFRAMGFRGRLRATGPVIADQYAYLRACGFDEVEPPERVSNRQPEAHWKAAAKAITAGYQRSYPGPSNILEARRAARDIRR